MRLEQFPSLSCGSLGSKGSGHALWGAVDDKETFDKETTSYYKCKCLDLWCVYDRSLEPNKAVCHHRILLMSLTGRMGFNWIKLCLLGQVKSLRYCLADRKLLLYLRADSDHFGPLRNVSGVILEKNNRIGKTGNYYWTSIDVWAVTMLTNKLFGTTVHQEMDAVSLFGWHWGRHFYLLGNLARSAQIKR